MKTGVVFWRRGGLLYLTRQNCRNTQPPPVVLTSFQILSAGQGRWAVEPAQKAVALLSGLRLFLELPRWISSTRPKRVRLHDGRVDKSGCRPIIGDGLLRQLPAENYTFRSRGSNSNGVWNEEGLTIALTVIPPWWKLVV
jgi:hypothetical protein